MRCMTATLSNPMPSLPEDPSFFSDNALVLVATFGPSNHFFGQKKVPCVKVWHFWVRGNMPLDDTPKTCFLYKGLPCSSFQLAKACLGMKRIASFCIVLRHGVGRHLDKGMWQHPSSEFSVDPSLQNSCVHCMHVECQEKKETQK